MKAPRYEVVLRLHEDDNGLWGLCPENAVGVFDAFWGADGVFHDVFEHYFEGQHPYFSGQAVHTIYGEMAASGAGIALRELGIDSFRYREYAASRDYTVDTWFEVEEGLRDGYERYAMSSEYCLVPRQKEPRSWNYRTWLNEYEYKLYTLYNEDKKIPRKVKVSSVRNCYAWGYKKTDKLVLDRDLAHENLNTFLEQWHNITRQDHEHLFIADEMAYGVRSFKFKVYDNFKTETTIIDDVRNEYPIEMLSY